LAIIFAAWINLEANQSAQQVSHSVHVTAAAELVLGDLRDAETGQRGFLLTDKENYLQPYGEALGAIATDSASLQALVAGDTRQSALVQQVAGLEKARLDLLAQAITAQRAGNHQGALDIILSDTGKHVMDQIRALIASIKDNETTLLATRADAEMTARIVSSIAVLLALAGLIYLGWRQIVTGGAQNISLRDANLELERLVEERTEVIKQERQRIETLLHDVNHRIGNNLGLVSAILQTQRRRSSDATVKQALASAQDRVQAIALAHRRLNLDLTADTVAAKPYLESLVGEIAEAVSGRGIAFDLDVADLELPGRDAVYYVIIVNELLTNAVKHAFPDDSTGRVAVRLKAGEGNTLVLVLEDDGVGRPDTDENATGLGGTIVDSAVQTLNATMTTTHRDANAVRRGVRTTIIAPRA
jgi:two-component sensor histidine kinase